MEMIQTNNQAEALHLVLLLAVRVGRVWSDQEGINWSELDFLKQAVEQYLKMTDDQIVIQADELVNKLYSIQQLESGLSEILAHDIR